MPAKKTTPKAEPVAETKAEPVVTLETYEYTGNDPRPWHIEIFSVEENYGYRIVAANGTVVRDSGLLSQHRHVAVEAAAADPLAVGL